MKRLVFLLTLLLCYFASLGQVHVDGYYRSNGTYVEPHYRSSPDGNPYNNYSYPGNYNPYTGKVAGGSEEAYLRNYYRTYASYGGGSVDIKDYNHNLLEVNYWGAKGKSQVDIHNDAGIRTGYIRKSLSNSKRFFIYDINGVDIGMIEFKRSSYTVYDSYGMKLYAVKSDGSIKQPMNRYVSCLLVFGGIMVGMGLLIL